MFERWIGARIALVIFVLCAALPTYAQESSLSITVTPSLFQLSIGPGESWSSSVKVVNNNLYDATYYAQVLDFEAGGEDGSAKYMPILAGVSSTPLPYSLASWLTIPQEPISIKAGHSQQVPFTLTIPQNAEPGGHYAAILVGTKPPEGALTSPGAKISSFVSSLMFVRIKGDVVESGRIREFFSTQSVYQVPKSDFVLRFENTGNTHVHPQGDVVIYNMWGKERGRIAINSDNNFGNVLPKSVRRFKFNWESEANAFDIGPYRAEVTLAYGEDGRKNVTARTYFWVIPTGPLIATFSTVVALVLLLVWFIRRYIRVALELEKARTGRLPTAPIKETTLQVLLEPLKEGVVDLRAMRSPKKSDIVQVQAPTPSRHVPRNLTGAQFIAKYKLFFGFVALVLVCTLLAWAYFERALAQHRAYKIQAVTSEIEESIK